MIIWRGEYKDAAEQADNVGITALKAGVAVIEVNFANNTWKVLDLKDGNALLLSKEVIGERPYNDELEYITWEECTLRKWLNQDYLNSNFNESEREAIVETTVVNAANSEYGTDGGNDTVDKIFLLSIDEVNQYFATDKDRIARDAEGDTAWWWLRSPGKYSDIALNVYSDGSVDYYLYHVLDGHLVDDVYGAVRPALWVDLSNL